MHSKKLLALLATGLITVGAACSSDPTTADTTNPIANTEETTAATDGDAAVDDATMADTALTTDVAETATADTSAASTVGAAPATVGAAPAADGSDGGGGGGGRGGPGGSVSPASVTTIDEMNSLVQTAYGEASLGLHRGHQDVESTLIEVLGISHDEMHVRMETQGQNLEAVANDLGIDPQTLIDALVAQAQPAVDNLLAAGTITDEQAAAYTGALAEAYTYRVTWDGSAATPTFAGVA